MDELGGAGTVVLMLASILQRLDALGATLETVADQTTREMIRTSICSIEHDLVSMLDIDGAVIDVESEHESYAIAAVTAYLDGASRGDGFELLGETVASGVVAGGGDLRWVAGVLAALARLSGDLAVLAASQTSDPEWGEALGIIRKLAHWDIQ